MRGIEARRADTPAFIKNAQEELLGVLAGATNRKEFQARISQVIEMTCGYLDQLRSGQVPFEDLAITQSLSRHPSDYTKQTLNAIVGKQLLESGVELSAGQHIRYVITEHKARVPNDRARALEHLEGSLGYDAERYGELLLRAVEALLAPVGVRADTLRQWIAKELPAPRIRSLLTERTTQPDWGPLFEFMERKERQKTKAAA